MGFVLGVLLWLAFASWSVRIGVRKRRPVLGSVLGVLLGWIGVIVMLLVPARREELPSYQEQRYLPPAPTYYQPPPSGPWSAAYTPPPPEWGRPPVHPSRQEEPTEPDWTQLRP